MLNWLRGIFSPKPDNKEVANIAALKEAAIKTWEQDKGKNPDRCQVVRGDDGLPVEILETKVASGLSYSMLLNGDKHQITDGELMKGLRQLINNNLYSQSEAMKQFAFSGRSLVVQLLDYGDQGEQFYLVGENPNKVADYVHIGESQNS